MTAGRSNANSSSQDWCTPPRYIDAIRDFFGGTIELDPCSNPHSMVNAEIEYLLPEKDGLAEMWNYSTIFVNPPYGRDKKRGTTIKNWLRRCSETHAMYGAEILALVPVATNTSHWKDCIFGCASGIAFLYDTRLKFWVGGSENAKGAPMACSIIYWGRQYNRFEEIFMPFGAVVNIRHLCQ